MNNLFQNLKGLNFEDGAKLIRNAIPEVREQMNKIDETACDFDFMFNEEDYFHYTTTMTEVQDDAPSIDLENGYWGLMFEGNHLTHTGRDFGTVNYKGIEYKITCDAWVDNKGTDGQVVYLAYCKKDGKRYKVEWNTTEKYDLSGKLYALEEKLKDLESYKGLDPHQEAEKEEIEKEINELETQGISSFYFEDGANACDWDNASDMWEVTE